MSVVVEKLKAALELQEQEQIHKAVEQEYKEILKSADPPLKFLEFPVNSGKTLLSINDKGEVFCERTCIEACLDQIQYDRLEDPSGFENSRFPGGRCYSKHEDELKVRVRARFLYPLITYVVNLVFRNAGIDMCKTLHYKLNGETKCCMVYDTYEKEDGWFVVPLYQFTSDHKIAHFEINFEGIGSDRCKLQVAGFEFRPIERTVELHDQGLAKYQDIVKAASQPLFYQSHEEFKELLSIGFYISNYKTWFSLNENGEHCEMLSIADCLISSAGGYSSHYTNFISRFPCIFKTNKKGFQVHIRTQFLTPLIDYTVNIVLCNRSTIYTPMYVALRYKLEGESETSIVYLATKTKDNRSFIAELYQFTSTERTFDLEVAFEDYTYNLIVEGILFQPLEKVEHEQVLEDEEVSNDSMQWRMKQGLVSNLLKRFHIYNDQTGYTFVKNGKKSLMLSARGVIEGYNLSFQSSSESRFGEVVVITYTNFNIAKRFKSDVLSPETTYAIYLVYKLNKYLPVLQIQWENSYIYLVSPPDTPIIGQKLDQNTQKPLNRVRPKLDDVEVPRQRSDGWMEIKVRQLQTPSYYRTIYVNISLLTPDYKNIRGLIIDSIEVRPIVAHSA
ncbi:kinase-like domain, phloem protein 2-like protein [Tanacetum coccineum]|uniref:Kinase-like domain, phloem protein 2-like protein n=1 Tax=Tanacetum coccineum TaxID=301880 RepID=A0ABQ5ILB1_9ASTR